MDENIIEIADDLKGKLASIQQSMNSRFAGLSDEAKQKIKGPHMDFNKAMKAVKDGNVEELYKLAK